MAIVYYDIFFGISVLLTLCYTFMWHKHFDIHFTLIFSFIPITNLGYVLMVHSHELETALTSLKVTYIGGCYLILFIMLNIFHFGWMLKFSSKPLRPYCSVRISMLMKIENEGIW